MDFVENWLSRLSPYTAKTSGWRLGKFQGWLAESGCESSLEELVIFQKGATGDDRFRVLDIVQKYIGTIRGRQATKRLAYAQLRSFFLHNRADLPSDRSFRIKGDLPKTQGSLTVEELRRIVLSCNSLHRAIYLTMFQSGMGLAEFLYWNTHGWKDYKRQLDDGERVIRIDLPGRKRMKFERPYYTFHTGDALAAVKEWLPERPRDSTQVFSGHGLVSEGVSKVGLQSYWFRHLRELKITERVTGDIGHRTGKGIHELRDLWRSQWSKSPAKNVVAEYLMGHPTDQNEYDKSFRDVEVYREEYLKALPYLQIMSGSKPYHLVDENEVERLREELAKRDTLYENMRHDIFELQQRLGKTLKE